jgi:small subunit ribosomal protein S16
MAVKLRLTRIGGKGKPVYRIVAAHEASPRDGKFLEILGHYDPNQDPAGIRLKEERIRDWIAKGAKPTTTVSRLLFKQGLAHQAIKA